MTMLTLPHEQLQSLRLHHAHSDAVSALPYRQAEKDHSTESGAEYKASQLHLINSERLRYLFLAVLSISFSNES